MGNEKSDSREHRTEQYERHLKDPLEALRNDLHNLAVRIQYYRELFVEDSSRVDLLNQTASTFFHVVQQALFREIVVRFSSATDRAKTGGNHNLSLPFIVEKIEELQLSESSELIITLREKLSLIRNGVVQIRKIRDKIVAHRDLEHALRKDSELGASIKEVEDTYKQVGYFMNDIELFFTNSTHGYPTELLASRNGALSLIGALKRSIRDIDEVE